MGELTYYELIEIRSRLRLGIVETKCFIETFGDEAGDLAKTLKRLKGAYEKIGAMLEKARFGREAEDNVST